MASVTSLSRDASMTRIAVLVAVVSLGTLTTALAAAQSAPQSGYELFQQALVMERTHGKIEDALRIYDRITREYPSDRSLVAKALLAIGQSYEKLNNPEADKAYKRLVDEYRDQSSQVADARLRLAALASSDGARIGLSNRRLWKDLGRGYARTDIAALSPDGRFLSFTGGSSGLAVLDMKAGKIISPPNLGDAGAYVQNSVVSPDGRQVAYCWDFGGGREELRVVPVSDSKSTQSRSVFLNAGYLRVYGWSPDGRSVLVFREVGPRFTGQLAVISIADGVVRALVDSNGINQRANPTFSPDGSFVAYSSAGDIFTVASDGKKTRVVEHPAADTSPLWSPDGSQIVFLSNRTGPPSLWMIPVTGGAPSGEASQVTAVPERFMPLSISRSGALFYISGDPGSDVYTAELDANGNALTPAMATSLLVNSTRGGVWSPDGQALAYLVPSPLGTVIRIRSGMTGQDRPVRTEIPISGGVKWFPDGQSLLVPSRKAGVANSLLGFYRVNISSGSAELLHATPSQFVWSTRPDLSRDGKTILYLDASRQPVLFDMDSRGITELPKVRIGPRGLGETVAVALSPDGAQVAYSTNSALFVVSATGGPPRQVVRNGGAGVLEREDGMGVTWSADQRHLFYVQATRNDIGGIMRVPLIGGEPQNIGVSLNRIRHLQMHPDGRRITFDSVIDAPDEVWALENFLPKPGARR